MEKINKVDMGLLNTITCTQGAFDCRAITEVSFVDVSVPTGLQNLHNERCYLVEKSELDAYMARKESLEKTKGTPEWYLSNRIKQLEAENANLRDINKSLREGNSKLAEKQEDLKEKINKFYGVRSAVDELRAANEKLKAEVYDLNARIDNLEHIREFLDEGNTALITENKKLRGENVKLRLDLKLIRDSIDAAMLREKHVYE